MDKAKTVRIEHWTDIQELVAMSIGTDKELRQERCALLSWSVRRGLKRTAL